MTAKTNLLPTRRSLLSRLRNLEDDQSWREFFEAYWKLIYGAGRQSGLTDSEAQDLVQETIISVSKAIPTFRYDPALGSFKGWLLNLTRWRIVDQMRQRGPRGRKGAGSDEQDRDQIAIDEVPDPLDNTLGCFWDREWEKNVIEVAIERVKGQIDPKVYQVFDFFVLHEWPARKVAAHLHVGLPSVYVTKHRVSKLIKKEMQKLERLS